MVTAGLAVSFRFGALANVPVFAGDQCAARSVVFWSLGDFGFARWGNLPLAVPGLAVVLVAGSAGSDRLMRSRPASYPSTALFELDLHVGF